MFFLGYTGLFQSAASIIDRKENLLNYQIYLHSVLEHSASKAPIILM